MNDVIEHFADVLFLLIIVGNCGPPPVPTTLQTMVTETGTTYLSVATYSCTDMCYQLVPDEPNIVCQEDEQWSPSTARECECNSNIRITPHMVNSVGVQISASLHILTQWNWVTVLVIYKRYIECKVQFEVFCSIT